MVGTGRRVGAALTTTGRSRTARWAGSGKRDGKAYARNQRLKPRKRVTSSKPGGSGLGKQRASESCARRTLEAVFSVSAWEATVKVCGVVVAMLPGYSWAPPPSNDSRVNVGTTG